MMFTVTEDWALLVLKLPSKVTKIISWSFVVSKYRKSLSQMKWLNLREK